MKVVVAGGSGQLGQLLRTHFERNGSQVTTLSRTPSHAAVPWDGRSLGDWTRMIDGADAVVNLSGRSVNCRYTAANLKQMLDSRVESTRVMGEAISQSSSPPAVWLQMSTATIYAHRFDAPNDEYTGAIGGSEPDAPLSWRNSIDIATAWEAALQAAGTPATRKVALRTAMVMSPEPGGVFQQLSRLTRLGLGGPIAGGRQFVSWIHARDFVRAIEFLLKRPDVAGPVNIAAPHPLRQRDFMATLRQIYHVPIGLPATRPMLELGTRVLQTESELLLKSRRVVPRRLLEAGFTFDFPDWPAAAHALVRA